MVALGEVFKYFKLVPRQFDPLLEHIRGILNRIMRHERNIQKLRNKNLIENIVKTICGFGNANGGELIIGKRDDGTIFGLEHDMELLKEPNVDQLKNHLINIFTSHIKDTGFISKLTVTTKTVDSKTICLVKVPPRGKSAIFTSENIFYVRLLTATRKLDGKELFEYTKENFS